MQINAKGLSAFFSTHHGTHVTSFPSIMDTGSLYCGMVENIAGSLVQWHGSVFANILSLSDFQCI